MAKGDVFTTDAERPWEAAGEGIRRKVLSYDDNVMMVRVAFEAGATGAPHSHPHLQCSLVEKGAFEVTIAGTVKRLTAGDTFFVPSNAIHGVVAHEEGILLDVFTPMRKDFISESAD